MLFKAGSTLFFYLLKREVTVIIMNISNSITLRSSKRGQIAHKRTSGFLRWGTYISLVECKWHSTAICSRFLSWGEDILYSSVASRCLKTNWNIMLMRGPGRTTFLPIVSRDCGPKYWDLFFSHKHFNGWSKSRSFQLLIASHAARMRLLHKMFVCSLNWLSVPGVLHSWRV